MKLNLLKRSSCLRKEQIDGRAVVGSIIIFLFSGILSRAFSGSPLYMIRLLGIGERIQPMWFYILMWSFWYILLGFCFGCAMSGRFCGRRAEKFKGSLCLVVMMIFNLVWYPLFFAAKSPFLALIDILIIIFFCVLSLIEYSKLSKLLCFLIFIHFLWLLWCFITNLKVFLGA